MADVSYTRVNWAAYPSTTTKTSATNFNVMDKGIKDCADAVNALNHSIKIVDCSTGRSTAAKTVALTGFTLEQGAKVTVKFTSTGTTDPSSGNITLNVNSTGAKNIVDSNHTNTVLTYSNGSYFCNGNVYEFVYDGTYYVLMNRGGSGLDGVFYTTDAAAQADLANIPEGELVYTDDGDSGISTATLTWYGTCGTAAATAAKAATISGSGFGLVTGVKVRIRFTYANTATTPTLNVGSTGAITIYGYGTTRPNSWWKAGDVVEFTYNGSYWIMSPTQGQVYQINNDLTDKVEKWSGTASGATYVTVDKLAYDSTNKKLGLKVNGADTVIPFSGETVHTGTYKTYGVGTKDMGASHAYRYVNVQPYNIFTSWGNYWVPIVGRAISRGRGYAALIYGLNITTESLAGGVLLGRLKYSDANQWGCGFATTAQPIDVTPFSKLGLYYNVSFVGTYTDVTIGLTNNVTTQTTGYVIRQGFQQPSAANTNMSLEIDVSDISGEYYPFIGYEINQAGSFDAYIAIITFGLT